MKVIYPTNIRVPILVDDDKFEELSKHKWYLTRNGYAARSVWVKGKNTSATVYMHRYLLNPPEGFDAEHMDWNRVNNQMANLRLATRSENMANVRRQKKKSAHSKYVGVSLMKNAKLKKPWLAYIRKDYKTTYLGYYATEVEAAKAYNAKAIEVFGDFSSLNDIPDHEPNAIISL